LKKRQGRLTVRRTTAKSADKPGFKIDGSQSAGRPDDGASATKDAVRAMKERGLDISGHRSRSFRTVNLDNFDLLVALTPAIGQDLQRAGVEVSKVAALNIPDPYNKGLDAYRATAGAIEGDLKKLFGKSRS
jgi:protein-tyrosine-phosphatase